MAGETARINRSGPPTTVHKGASKHLGDLLGWNPPQQSSSAVSARENRTLTDRTRELEANNGIAAGGAQMLVDHVIGPQLRVQPMPAWRAIPGRDMQWAREWSQQVAELFSMHANSPRAWDVEKKSSMTDMAGIALRGAYSGGGHLVLPYFLERPGVRYGTCFLSVEIDRLKNPPGKRDSKTLKEGIQYDDSGLNITGYHIRKYHPGDSLHYGVDSRQTEFVPVEFPWGRPRVLHVFAKTRSGQVRGTPMLASVLRRFKNLDRYRDAALQTAVARAQNTYFIKTEMAREQVADVFSSGKKYLETRAEYNHTDSEKGLRQQIEAQLGELSRYIVLFPNENVEADTGDQTNPQFNSFCRGMLSEIALALGTSLETLTRDFTQSSYASARAAIQMDWRRFLGLRRSLVGDGYAMPGYGIVLEEMVELGDVEAEGFYEHLIAYTRAMVIGAGRGWIDPAKESAAAKLRLESGLTNLAIEHNEQGLGWQEIAEQRIFEVQFIQNACADAGVPEALAWQIMGMRPPTDPLYSTPLADLLGLRDNSGDRVGGSNGE